MCGGIDDGYSEGFVVAEKKKPPIIICGDMGAGHAYREFMDMAIGMCAAAGYNPVDHELRKYLKPGKHSHKCILPGCDKMTNHNGGYCCAEHCKAHRAGKVLILGEYHDKGY